MAISTSTNDWTGAEALVGALGADLDALVQEAGRRIRQEAAASIAAEDDVEATIAESLGLLVRAAAERRLPTAFEADIAVGTAAAMQARQGVTLESVLHRYRLISATLWRALAGRAAGTDVAAPELLELAQLVWDGADVLMLDAARAHRLAEQELERHTEEERRSFLRALLLGSITPYDLRARAREFGLSLDRAYIPFRARTSPGLTVHRLEEALLAGATDDAPGLTCLLEGTLLGLLPGPPSIHDIGGVVGLGPPSSLELAKGSFQHATRALETALSFGLTGVFRVEDLPLGVLVASEPHVGDALVDAYLRPLDGMGQFGPAIIATLREFFRRGMRVEETARALEVHPNTLRHRLRRFEEVTGTNLGETEQLFRIWWALERRSLLERQHGLQD